MTLPEGRTGSPRPAERLTRRETVAVVQGAWFLLTGIWPLLSLRSFEAVTGPKRERWLVKTVGGLIGCVGGALLLAGMRRRVTPELAALGASSAAFLGGVDVVYSARGRIRPVYLADALAEAVLVGGWVSSAGDAD